MRDPVFRDVQRAHLRDPHVAPVNALVDELAGGERGWLPHVAPVHGGTRARLLWVLRDPGPKVVDPENAERGFLCVENDDATAARLCHLIDGAGIGVGDTVPWNAYPWYINKAPSTSQLGAGADALARLLPLLPDARTVVLLGAHARRCWDLLASRHPAATADRHVLVTRHASAQAFIGSPAERDRWRAEQQEVFLRARELMVERSSRA